MRPLTLVLPVLSFTLFFALPLHAQSPDPSISILDVSVEKYGPNDRVAVGLEMYYSIEWKGIDPAAWEQLVVEFEAPFVLDFSVDDNYVRCKKGNPVRCTFDNNVSRTRGILNVRLRAGAPGTYKSVARILTNGAADTNPANNVATHTFEVFALPVLSVAPEIFVSVLEPGQELPFRARVLNLGATPATNVVFTVSLPAGGAVLSGISDLASCSIAANILTCTAASLAGGYFSVDGMLIVPDRLTGEEVVVEMTATSAEQDFDPEDNRHTAHLALRRQFVVTNTADEGTGSLRQAMHDVNALCPAPAPCGIIFRIPPPVPQGGWFTIEPRTPLPVLGGAVKIDGTSQTAFTGDTNAEGPEIELAGAQLENSGLRLLADCTMSVHGLAVNGFRGYGIEVRRLKDVAPGDPCAGRDAGVTIADNYIGTDARGRTAKPNHRGLGIFSPSAVVERNLISGNSRSGIYAGGDYYANISQNRIGVASDGSPLGNGAGIMFDLNATVRFRRSSADVTENVIAYNDMAVARTRAGEIFVSRNSIFDNRQQAIDVDLDAMTPNRADDKDVPNRPVLFSATFDPVRNATIVRGRVESIAFATSRMVEVFASTRNSVWSMPQAEHSVALHFSDFSSDFEIVVPLDLRGQWITAAFHARRDFFVTAPRPLGVRSDAAYNPANTSELSDALYVQ